MDDEEKRARQREYSRRYRQRNAEKIRDTQRKPEQRARARANQKAWRERNRDKLREKLRRERRANPEKHRAYHREWSRKNYRNDPAAALAATRFSHHGMRPEDWAALWEAQDGRCYLCGKPLDDCGPRQVHIDHDHSCCLSWRSCIICRRGLACHQCNTLIGLADDDPDRLRRIADALEAAQAAVESRKATMSEQLILDIN